MLHNAESRDLSKGPANATADKPPAVNTSARDGKRSLLVALLALAVTVVSVVYIGRLVSEPRAPAELRAGSRAGPGLGPRFVALDRPRPVPQLQFTDEAGRALSLAEFRGKVILLNICGYFLTGPAERRAQ